MTLLGDKVTVGTTTFNEYATKPASSVVWEMDTLDGWEGTSEIDVISTPIGGEMDGEIAGGFFPARARHLTASGVVMGDSRINAEALRDLITRDAFPRNQNLTLTRFEGVPKQITVKVAGRREFVPVGPLSFRWIVPLLAPDPFKYASSASSVGPIAPAGTPSGGVQFPVTFPFHFDTIETGAENVANVYNSGTVATYPTVVLTGPLVQGGWRLTNDTTGKSLAFDVGISSTDTMEIDFKNQVGRLNGSVITNTVIGDFWSVAPGVNAIKLYADYDASADFTVTIRSAWE